MAENVRPKSMMCGSTKSLADVPAEVPANGWRCTCGRSHQAYESCCICGKAKYDVTKPAKAKHYLYGEKIDKKLCDLFARAIKEHAFYPYFRGLGKYKLYLPGDQWFCSYEEFTNSALRMLEGIELYHRNFPKFDVQEYVTYNLKMLVVSSDYNQLCTAVEILHDYIFLTKTNRITFQIDIIPVFEMLRQSLFKAKDTMVQLKMWERVKLNAHGIERFTGHNILPPDSE